MQVFTKVQQRLHQFERPIVGIALTVIVLSLAGHILTAPLDHDEHMYLTAASLLDDHSIYSDFSYFQTPLMPYVYNAALALPGGNSILLTARLVKVALAALLVLAVYGLLKRLTASRWIALGLLLFFVHNDVLRFTLALARNYDLPLLLTVLAVWLLATPPARLTRLHAFAPVVLAGMLATLCVGFKLTYAVVPLALGAALLVSHRPRITTLKQVGGFIAGGLVGLLPLLAIFLATPRDLFLFNNLGYHDLNTLWRLEHEPLATMTLGGKLTALASELSDNNSLALLLVILTAGILLSLRVRQDARGAEGAAAAHPSAERTDNLARVGSANAVHPSAESTDNLARAGSVNATHPPLIIPLVLAGLTMVLVPTPSLTSYNSLLIVSLVLAAAMLFSRLNGRSRRYTGTAILLIAAVMIVSNLPRDWRNLAAVAQPDRWTGVQLHRQARALHDQIPPGERDKPVFTLSPLYALEAGLPVYPELSAGVFGYRVAEYLSEQDAEGFRLVSPLTVDSFLNRTPPSLLLTGFEGELERGIDEWATSHGYVENRTLIPAATIYLAP